MAKDSFGPFEGMGGSVNGNVNTPLSLHGEMMAIHSALAAYTSLASTEAYCKQPHSKLLDGAKGQGLRSEALKAFVETTASAASTEDETAAAEHRSSLQCQE